MSNTRIFFLLLISALDNFSLKYMACNICLNYYSIKQYNTLFILTNYPCNYGDSISVGMIIPYYNNTLKKQDAFRESKCSTQCIQTHECYKS